MFVNLDGDAEPLGAGIAPFEEIVAPFRLEAMETCFEIDELWDANWKCAVENFLESYHLFKVHKQTVQRRTPTSSVRCFPGGRRFTYHRLTMRNPATARLDGLPAALRDVEILAGLFPAMLLSVTAEVMLWMSALPLGTDRTRLIGGICLAPELREDGADHQRRVDQLASDFALFTAEDRAIVERLTLALKSPLAQPGPLSPLEQPVWEFGTYFRRTLLEACDSG